MKKLLIFALVFVMLAAMLASCNKDDTPDGGDTTPTDDQQAVDTTPAPVTTISLDNYSIIRADRTGKEVTNASGIFRRTLVEKLGKEIKIDSDWVRNNDEVTIENDDPEILLGATNRKESREAIAELTGSDDYIIRVVGNKILITGTSDAATMLALNRFTEMFLGGDTIAIPSDLNIVHTPGAVGSPAYTLATEYTAIRSDTGGSYSEAAIAALRTDLEKMTGKSIKMSTDNEVRVTVPDTGVVTNEKEILLGLTNRAESFAASKTVGAMDYTISITDTKVVIYGGTYLSTLRGITHFMDALRTGAVNSLEAGSYTYTEVFTDLYTYNPLCYDSSSFVPDWQGKYNIPDWLRDFDEKVYAITRNDLRNMSVAHRNEIAFYPENSIEGILSAILGGTDVIEIDVTQTKDHVLVLMHDSTLKRTTDFNDKKGKDGLPTSEYIWDWTYAQLQQLNLKTNNGKVTEYKIPTLYEAMMVMKDRCFIHLDQKVKNLPIPRELTRNAEIFAMANEIGCRENFLYTYGITTLSQWQNMDNSDPEYNAFVSKVKKYLAGGKIRSRYWCWGSADVSTLNTDYEKEKYWVSLRAEGKTLLWANNLLPYTQYIADNFSPAQIP